MKNSKSKFNFILILLVITGIISWFSYLKVYVQNDTVNIHLFPKTISGWISEEVTITEIEYNILETRNVFARKYKSPEGKEVMLFIVYSQHNRKISHPPEICYTGSGLSITEKKSVLIPIANKKSLQANRLSLEHGAFKQIAYYWFKVGNTLTASYWQQQLLVAIKTLSGQPSSSAMIRLSTVVNSGNYPKANQDVQEFGQIIQPFIFKYLP